MGCLTEDCGVFGIFSPTVYDVARTTYYGLFALQHRGQESCGIAVNDGGIFNLYKDVGLVSDVFKPQILDGLGNGSIAIGHVRYGTTEKMDRLNSQPIVVNHIKGRLALAFNGKLVNYCELRERLELRGAIFHTTSDTEVISYIITQYRLESKSIEEAVSKAMNDLDGAYSLVIMSATKLMAVRDKNGFRPLCFGKTPDGSYIIASETCALDSVGATVVRDVKAGEILVFDTHGMRSIDEHCGKITPTPCIFEHIYFARPDSVCDGYSVQQARITAGAYLAQEKPLDADVVIGVPDSGLEAAIGYARQSGIPYSTGFIKNRYIGRTFIAPGQQSREELVKIKLNPAADAVRGKRVVMVDDSIVRGTTSQRIVKLLREAGATEVHMRVTAPPFLNPCYYGTDISSRKVLISCLHTHEEIEKIIGVDSLGFLSLEHLAQLAKNLNCGGYCSACFDGNYPTAIPTETERDKYNTKINISEGN